MNTQVNETLGVAFHATLKKAKEGTGKGVVEQIMSHGPAVVKEHMKALKIESKAITKEKGPKHAMLHNNLIRGLKTATEDAKEEAKAAAKKAKNESIEAIGTLAMVGKSGDIQKSNESTEEHHTNAMKHHEKMLGAAVREYAKSYDPHDKDEDAAHSKAFRAKNHHKEALHAHTVAANHIKAKTQDADHYSKQANKFKLNEEVLDEILTAKHSSGEWVHDFVHSKNPKFAGKSKEKRIAMAIAAHAAAQRNESIDNSDDINTSNESVKGSNMVTFAVFKTNMTEWSADDMIAAAKEKAKSASTTKGTKYTGAEVDVNAEKPKFEKPGSEAEKEKRGRGRPAGSKSGGRA